MNLQEMLGDAYKEGMTIEEINTALSSKNLVDLSTGNYVDANKYNREIKELKNQIATKDKDLKTATAQASADSDTNQSLIAELQEQIKNMQTENNKNSAIASIAEAKSLLGIKDDDAEYNSFVSNVSGLDKTVSGEIVNYVNKQIKNAYEKGKQDGTKNSLGDMGKQRTATPGKSNDEIGAFGKKLAQNSMSNKNVDYFSRA